MATTITMPQLGETVTEGTVERWLKKPGDAIDKYEAFVEVSTDKVNSEVPSPVTGTIREFLIGEGTTVATGTPIAIIDEVAAADPTAPPSSRAAMAQSANAEPVPGFNIPQIQVKPAAASAPAPASTNGHSAAKPEPVHVGTPEQALRGVSPAVRRLAREHQIDVGAIRGTGANGRVTAEDVLAASRAAPARPASGTSTYGEPVPGTLIPLAGARRIIAERMVESKHAAPHAWSMVEADVTNAWKWRAREKDDFERETGYKLTLLPFFIRAVVESLGAFPLMNARFAAPSGSSGQAGIYVEKDVNIGIAIGLATNLVVPVVKHADKLSIKGIAIASGELIDRARKNKLSADDLQGGTFTVNNNGANGSYASAPIINAGQAGIVTMEAIVKKPIVTEEDAIAIRHMMNVCLSLDHRVVDGYVASRFLADLKRRLEAMGPAGAL